MRDSFVVGSRFCVRNGLDEAEKGTPLRNLEVRLITINFIQLRDASHASC